MDYAEYQSGHIIKKIIEEPVNMIPIGHHDLNRHIVYRVDTEGKPSVILKLFYIKNRWNREVATLKLLTNSDIKIPKLIKYGILSNGTEWLISQCIGGVPLDTVIDWIPMDNQKTIYGDIGRELGKIHAYQRFIFFGNWDENGNSLDHNLDFRTIFIRRVNSVFDQLFNQCLPEGSLHRKAADLMTKNLPLIETVTESRLCHNDFNTRNIMVNKVGDLWRVEGIIDFEQSFPWDKDIDLVYFYYLLFNQNRELWEEFIRGYKEFSSFNMDFYDKVNFYLLYMGLYICSWSYKPAPNYYKQGVRLLSGLV